MKTVRPVTSPGGVSTFGTIQVGDRVEVVTTDGRMARFVVERMDGEAIIAPDGVRYTRAEIAELKTRSFSGPKTVGLVAGIVGGICVIVIIVAANAPLMAVSSP